jgi:cytochrome oxidase Cu insertion factor (SCO1/SenC/PrrC family)
MEAEPVYRFEKALGLCLLLATAGMLLTGCVGAADGGYLAPGDRAPSFSLPAAGGEEVELADFAGQPVLLYFSMVEG